MGSETDKTRDSRGAVNFKQSFSSVELEGMLANGTDHKLFLLGGAGGGSRSQRWPFPPGQTSTVVAFTQPEYSWSAPGNRGWSCGPMRSFPSEMLLLVCATGSVCKYIPPPVPTQQVSHAASTLRRAFAGAEAIKQQAELQPSASPGFLFRQLTGSQVPIC